MTTATYYPSADDIARAPIARRESIAEFSRAPRAVRMASWRLAGAHYHQWAGCGVAAIAAGGETLVAEWARVEADDLTGMGGQPPGSSHTTGSGRLSWSVDPVSTLVEVSRPAGVVIAVRVPHDRTRPCVVESLRPESVFVRHIVALTAALDALHGPDYTASVVVALIERGGVGRPAYFADAYDYAMAQRACA